MSNPVRILHVIGIMNRGGAEAMIMNLYRNIDRTKVQFDFVENSNKPAVFDEEILSLGGRIYRCPHYNGKNHFNYTKWWHNFFSAHKGEHPIIHGHLGSTAAIYLKIAKAYGVYTIAHSHNTNTMKKSSDILYALFAYPTRFVADHFFACSADAGVSRYGKKIGQDNARCKVLHNAIDTAQFAYSEASRKATRTSLGIADDQFVIGNISRFSPQKNHKFLLEIFEAVYKKRKDAVLLLVGDGDLRPQIETIVAEKHLENAVILTGVQSNTWDYYQAMDVFLMPSLYEGLPVSMVEAQTAGLQCRVSTGVPRESAITELVQFRSLEDSPEQWADWVLACANLPRKNMTSQMEQAGFDISQTSQWLQNYYLEVVKNLGR